MTTPDTRTAVAGSATQFATVELVTALHATLKALPVKVPLPAGNWPTFRLAEDAPGVTVMSGGFTVWLPTRTVIFTHWMPLGIIVKATSTPLVGSSSMLSAAIGRQPSSPTEIQHAQPRTVLFMSAPLFPGGALTRPHRPGG